MLIDEKCEVALFDMDGTLFDYELGLMTELKKLAAPEEEFSWDDPEFDLWTWDQIPHIKARINMIRNIPGWWRNLPKFQLGWDLYSMARKVGYDIHILTKGPYGRPHAWQEKVECLHKHFKPEEVTIHITEDKKIHYGRVLIDDYPLYVEQWLHKRCRGLCILPKNESNKNFEHPNAIVYDGTKESGWKCEYALMSSYERENRQHWKDTETWQAFLKWEKDGFKIPLFSKQEMKELRED